MKKLTALCVASLLCSPLSAQSYFSELLIFGDSLLDSGNLGRRFTNRTGDYTTDPYANIAPQYLGLELGLATDPAASGGSNYAVGGYETADILNSINGTGLALPAGGPVARPAYLTENNTISSNALILIDGGGNDFLNGTATDQASIITSAQTLMAGVSALSDAGGRYIMLSNLPDLGNTPAAQAQNLAVPGYAATVSAGAAGYNQALMTYANFSSANIIPVDLAGVINYVSDNAETYGFASGANVALGPLATFDQRYMCFDDSNGDCIEHPIYGIDGISPDPDKLLFNDGVHPTGKVGEITGDYLIDVVVAPQLVGQLAGIGLGIARTQHDSLSHTLRENRWLENTDRMFINASGANEDTQNGGDQTTNHLTLGYNKAVSSVMSLGAALSMANHETDGGGADFSASSVGLSALANYRDGHWLAEGSVGLSIVDYGDVDRHFALGDRALVASGDTEGYGWHFDGQLAYNLSSSNALSIAPAIGARLLSTKVDAYTESGGAVSNYSWGEQSRQSRQLRAGVLANMAVSEGVSLYAELFSVSELEDGDETIEVTNTNLGYTSYQMPSYSADDDSFVDVSVGASVAIANSRLALNINYSDEGEGRESVMLNYALPF
ncbi:Esterase EstP [Zhongshania aliphaticivorans]|uniref:Esterase EstP n=1 Tax=Zhongshania aliphaticivorans TaxID=1470434 RepID=A0A5S9MZW1_9GAMM|nr:autotransporter domain-containing protein [Zhongshania aliphaticivorans]CAA0081847.1 Esterase EstP [Zhongshania aliphaticivorans]CAA0084718.1 Esterase EstP [Zhongshania aliphaticivorans]